MFKTFLIFFVTTLFIGVCLGVSVSAQKLAEFKLPAEVPEAFEIEWNQYGGMVPSFEIIKLNGKVLTHEQRKAGEKVAAKWTVDVTTQDVKALYDLFVEVRFDLIKN